MLAMAKYNETGFNMRVNPQKAEEYLQQAADAEEPEAMLMMAKKIIQGKLVSIDKLVAEDRSPGTGINGSPLSAKISNSGNLGASLSQSGRPAFKVALEYFEKASKAENPAPEALTILGTVYETGGLKCERSGRLHPLIKNVSIENAKKLYQDAA